jgi:multidrug transporter EmrE-like cation transporter
LSLSASLRARTIALILLEVVFASLGELMLGIGMKRIGPVRNWALPALGLDFVRVITSATIWAGIFLLLLFFACYLLVLSWADFSYVKPISAVGYGIIAILGYVVLHEQVSPTRWVGVACISLGVALTSQTEVNTTHGVLP